MNTPDHRPLVPSFLLPVAGWIAIGFGAGCASTPIVSPDSFLLSAPAASETPSAAAYLVAPGDLLSARFQFQSPSIKDGAFRLQPGNVITVRFVQADGLSEQQPIRPDGKISLPYLGEFRASALTIDELTAQLRNAYADILKLPDIYVVVNDYESDADRERRAWFEAERDGETPLRVRPDGVITLPLAGEVPAAGRTLQDLADTIESRYRDQDRAVDVQLSLEEHAVEQVYVAGHVERPGAFPLRDTPTLMAAVAQAGAPLSRADPQRVVVLRREGTQVVASPVDLRWLSAIGQRPAVPMRAGDVVYVPARASSHRAEMVRDILQIIAFRGWGFNFTYRWNDEDD